MGSGILSHTLFKFGIKHFYSYSARKSWAVLGSFPINQSRCLICSSLPEHLKTSNTPENQFAGISVPTSGEFSAHIYNYWQEANFDLALVKVNTIHSHTVPVKL